MIDNDNQGVIEMVKKLGPQPEFVQQARRTVQLADRLDDLTRATGWGMAGAWGDLRRGDLDAAEARIEEREHDMSVARHPASRAKEDTKFVQWVAAQDWPEAYLDDEEDES